MGISRRLSGLLRASQLLLIVAVSNLAVVESRAGTLMSFDFSGTLSTPNNGNSAVTGSFTLDTSGMGSLTAFDFTTPIGTISQSNGWRWAVKEFLPAAIPHANFVALLFSDQLGGADLYLLFGTSLASFSGSGFYTGLVTDAPGGNWNSHVACRGTECGGLYGSAFTSGSATPASTTIPEPRSSVLLATLLLTGAVVLRRRVMAATLKRWWPVAPRLNSW